jgi:hypothetical protein
MTKKTFLPYPNPGRPHNTSALASNTYFLALVPRRMGDWVQVVLLYYTLVAETYRIFEDKQYCTAIVSNSSDPVLLLSASTAISEIRYVHVYILQTVEVKNCYFQTG